ncbi:hypothetical protein Tco_0708758 [Tanacetum coccineum]
MSKNDMKKRICTLFKNDLKDLVKTYRIPQDLHPRFPDPGFTMDRLPGDAKTFTQSSSGFSAFVSLFRHSFYPCSSISRYCSHRYFVPCVSMPLQTRGLVFFFQTSQYGGCLYGRWSFKPEEVEGQRLYARLICLREMREEVLVRSGLSSVWFNKECDPMSIYDFMTLPSWSDAQVVEESHNLSSSLLDHVSSHTTAPTAEGAMIPLPTADEIAASLLDLRLAKKKLRKRASEPGSSASKLGQTEGVNEADLTDFCAKIKTSLERDEGTSARAASAPVPCLGKRLGAPPSVADVSASGPSHVGTSIHASVSRRDLSLAGVVASGHVGKSRAEVMRRQLDPLDSLARSALAHDAEYDQILDDDFGTASLSEEIDLTLFHLAPGPYHMPYPYEGVSSPLYTKEEWDGPHVSESNISCMDIFKDPNVCRKALDRTITPVELRRTKSLLPLELSNRVNILSALLVSHGYQLNSRYTNLVSSRALLQEKFDQKKRDVRLLRSKVTSLDDKLEKLQRDYDALGQENRELCSQRDVASEEELTRTDAKLSEQALTVRDLHNELALERSKSQGYKNSDAELRVEIAHFIGSGAEGLVQKLLSSDEFHATLAHVASLGIDYGVKRGLRMGRTDADFEMAVQKVSNFQVGAKADFDKALVGFPTTPFPFLSKVATTTGGTLFDVAHILPDKLAHLSTSVSVFPSDVNEAPDQVPL